MAENLEFKISTGLKDIIGKDLITDDFIAVFELVKNSYDAGAKNVIIKIEEGKITIADNGKGMSFNDIKDKWLFVAYSAKKDGTEDKNDNSIDTYRDKIQERHFYAGAKGIGRFSCDRLGKYLILKTKTKKNNLVEEIHINWPLFEKNQNELFEDVKVEYQQQEFQNITFPKKSQQGTVLEITGLYSNWNREQLKRLKHSLEKLINPFTETNDFSIEIECQKELDEDNKKDEKGEYLYIERDRINGEVKNSILEILNIKTTQIEVRIERDIIKSKIIDRGTLIYEIEEKNKEFRLLEEVKIDLYFLNTAAKYNFTRKMGVQPVNFGSVFLFKNGFRVQPFGETGDDSWGLDYRAQQGYNRFLGTRDLFGRVEITSENVEQFREVSSRDGGLIETVGYHQLMKAFKEKGLVRLERYVVGVLWGEGFRRRRYFGAGEEANLKADTYRKELQKLDKESEDISHVISNLGSKLDFIQIIKGLTLNREIEIIDFNRDFINLINERLDEVDSRFISELEIVAENIQDQETKNKLLAAERKYQELIKEREEALQRALIEEQRRIEAEKKAEEEERRRIEAEKKAKEEEEKRRRAELETLKKEKERAEAEVARLKAEKKAKEEEENRKKVEKTADNQKRQIDRFRSSESITYKDLRDSNHIIGVYADDISKKIKLFKRKLDRAGTLSKEEIIDFLQGISLVNEKINTITKFTTKSNFLEARLSTDEDLVSYIKNYVTNIYGTLHNEMKYEFITNNSVLNREFQPIELSVILDNILNNSKKKGALKVIFEFVQLKNGLRLSIKDIGKPLDKGIDKDLLFEEGVTSTKGAGLGLSHVKRILENDFNAKIEYNPNYTNGFELIIKFLK